VHLRRRAVRVSPLRTLTLCVAALAALLWTALSLYTGDDRGDLTHARTWGVLALLATALLLTEAMQLHVEVRGQALSLSLSEIPLVLGLFLVPAPGLLACRVLALLVVAAARRTALAKAAFNAWTVTAELAAVVLVFYALGGHRGPVAVGPAAWAAAYAALLVGTVLSGALVAAAIRRLQGSLTSEDLLLMAAPLLVSALLNTTAALLVLFVLEQDARAALLLAVLLGGCTVAYRAYGELLGRHRSLAQLQGLTAAWAQADGVRDVASALLLHGRALLRAGHIELHVRDAGSVFQASYAEPDQAPREVASAAGAALLARLLQEGRTVLLPRRRERHSGPPDALRDAIGVPLRHGGETFGVLLVANRLGETSTFDAADVELVEQIASQAAVALHNGRLIDRLRHAATHDSLTGLPNRAAFQEAMATALRTGSRFSVLLMDLDGFKDVNDTLGHHHGDELLRAVAGRLRAGLDVRVLVARLGGDEFAVLVPLEPDGPDGFGVAQLLHDALASPFLVDGVHLDVRASIGVSLSPDDGLDGPTLLKRADIAMYESKTSGAPVRAYDAAADRSSPRRLGLVAELRAAIDREELVCYYQPQLDLQTGQVTGAEALVRWPHGELGVMVPDDFIPVAEQTGLILPLTMLVLRTALRESSSWQSWGRPMGVAVNVSPRGLLAPGFAATVVQVLAETQTPAARLTLEVTESSVMADPGRAVRVLQELHTSGVRLSVDDFGTGYSSLAYLQRLPVDEVKIDKSFVRDLGQADDSTAIVRAIIDMGHVLGLQVLAEGVEDDAVDDLLTAIGCDLVQGFLYSPPLPAAEFWSWCADVTQRGSVPHRRTPGGETSPERLPTPRPG